ncbi:MAG TPA: cupredoxin domain-containing protein [Actinomycetota bacterium]
MPRKVLSSAIPTVVTLAALFLVLPRGGAEATIRMTDAGGAFSFDPAEAELPAGSQLEFVNDTTRTHTADCPGCPWHTGDVQPAQSVVVVVEQPGAYSFACRYHPEMTGVLTVS